MKIRKTSALILASVTIAFLAIGPAAAQSACGPRDGIVKRLAEVYKESPRAMGIVGNGNLVEVFVSESGSWTMMVTVPGRPTCVFSAGNNWRSLAAPAKPSL